MTDAKPPAQPDWATELSDAQGHVTLSEQEAHEIGARLRSLGAENDTLTLYKSLADEYGLSIFKDLKDLTTEIENLRADRAMRAAQPAGAQQPVAAYAALTHEQQRAVMEAERNASLDAYSRVVYLTGAESRLYEAGFTNGWQRASHGQAPASKIEGLTAAQESLGVEFEKVLHDNLFDLYEESAPHGQAPASTFGDFIRRTNEDYAAWCATQYTPEFNSKGPDLHGLWAWQEQQRRMDDLLRQAPINLNCKSEQKRLATLWGFVPAQPAPAAVAGPSDAELPDVEDMAHSAVQEALSFGVNHDVLHRWMRAVMDKTVEAMLAAVPTTQPASQQAAQEPVAGQCRFTGAVWSGCSAEHARMVLANPEEWEGYEVRYLYTAPQPSPTAQEVEGVPARKQGANHD